MMLQIPRHDILNYTTGYVHSGDDILCVFS